MRWAARNTRRNEIEPARVGGGLFVASRVIAAVAEAGVEALAP